MKDIIKMCNLMIIFSKFTLNIMIYKDFEGILSKLVWKKNTLLTTHPILPTNAVSIAR